MELKNLDIMNPAIKGLVEKYCKKMLELHKDNIITIILYGSATGKDFITRKSNINLLVVMRRIRVEDLTKSLKLVSAGRKKRIVAPLFFTEEHIRTSTDTFPIEFQEIKDNYLLIFGKDLFCDLEIKYDNMRHRCEQQLKANIIRLRQGYLEVGLSKRGLEKMLVDSLTSFLPVFRNMLRLKGEAIPKEKNVLLKEFSRVFEGDFGVFNAILKDKQGDEQIGGRTAVEFFEKYLIQLNRLAGIVDKL